LLYQKDGPSPLKRVYADRIAAPRELCDQQHDSVFRSGSYALCRLQALPGLIAAPYLHEKETRLAFLVEP